MEIELKYLVENDIKAQEVLNDQAIGKTISSEPRVIPMHAIYYDTKSGKLSKNKAAVRIRKEGDEYVATSKWGGGSTKGLHTREEVNVVVKACDLDDVGARVFEGTKAFEVLSDIIEGETLIKVVEMRFTRIEKEVSYKGCSFILSYDQGMIYGKESNTPIREIELELIKGNQDDLIEIGHVLEKKYALETCNISKLARGLVLNQ